MNLSETESRYSNFFRVGYNAYEMVFEFGQQYSDSSSELIYARIVTTVPYAKAFCELLAASLQEHAAKYGSPSVHET